MGSIERKLRAMGNKDKGKGKSNHHKPVKAPVMAAAVLAAPDVKVASTIPEPKAAMAKGANSKAARR